MVIATYLAVSTVKNQAAEKHYGAWWTVRLKGVRLSGLSPTLLDEAQRALVSAGKAPQTVLHYLKFLRHILNGAVRYGKLDRNPFDKVTLPGIPKGEDTVSHDRGRSAAVGDVGPTYGLWARLAILTGLRMRMRWADVNFEKNFVMLPSTKSGEAQYAKLNQEAVAILLSLSSWQQSKYMFPSQNLAQPMNQRNFTTRILQSSSHAS